MTITDNQQLTQKNANLDLPPLFAEWISSWELEEILSPILRRSLMWAKQCSPPNASLDNLALACMDLALWFFYFDDCLKEDYNIVFEKCSKILDGYQPSSDETKLFQAHADVINRIAQKGYDMQYYLKERKDNLRYRVDLAKQRLYGRNNENKLSFNQYAEIRRTTIGTTYLSALWEILGDFYLSPVERSMPEVQRAAQAMSSAYSLHNDLYSLVRDIKEGNPNLVILHMEQYGGDIFSSGKYINELFQEEVKTFRYLFELVLNSAPSDCLRQYFEFSELSLNYITRANLMEKDYPDHYSSNLELAVIAYNQQNS